LGHTRGGVEKVASWSTKAAVSLKWVKIEEKLLWRAYIHSFERYHPRPPTASSSPRLGVRNLHPKLQSLLSWNGWSYGLQIWQEHSQGPSEQKPVKNFWEKGAWAYSGTAQFFGCPQLYSQEWVKKLRTSNLAGTFKGPSEQKTIKNFGKKGAGRIHSRNCPNVLGIPYYLRNGWRYKLQILYGYS